MSQDLVLGLQDAGWPVLLVNSAGAIAWSNAAAAKSFGPVVQGPGAKLAAIWSPENSGSAEAFIAAQEQSPAAAVPVRFKLQGGSAGRFLVSVCLCGKDPRRDFLLQLLPDAGAVTEGKAMNGEGQALKQKLDCALQLARTVALDFNNALTSILGHTSLILSKMEPGHPWRQSLLEVEKSSAKAAEIANDLGTFSRQEKEPRAQSAGNLNELLQRGVEFFQQNAGTTPVTWKLQLERKLFASKFDEAKMQQAFIKILENAVQAIEGDGRIIVQSRNIELAEPTQDRTAKLPAGAWVCAEISDNGKGIPEDILPRVFEPFFTTKRGPQHRGLGLAWVYGIVTNHGGGVAISSQVGRGTSVRVYLPAEKRIARDTGLEGQDLSGTQTILIVDDEDLLLTMGQTILSAYGYRVLTANSGQKALDLLSKPDCAVDLLITDLVMPAMSGRELVEHVQALCPSVKVVCTSGYIWPASQQNQGAYLQKPFTSQELLLKVKQALAPKEA